MFSVITNIYNESQRAYLNGIFHSHRKIEKVFFWQLEMFDVSKKIFSFPVAVKNSIKVRFSCYKCL